MYRNILLLWAVIFLTFSTYAQRVEPPFWWTGMQNKQLQLLVHSTNIAQYQLKLDYPGIKVIKIHPAESPNYLFIDLEIEPQAQAGSFYLDFYLGKKRKLHLFYQLKTRSENAAMVRGFDQSDLLYLLMPDRFANGNPQNDQLTAMPDTAQRSNPDGRHGGDIAGISAHLDYLKSLGITALWINPLLENNMPQYSYHGYAITDYYQIDARFGSNSDYLALVEKAKTYQIKIIMDMVFNHCGSEHWWMKDLPFNDWVHQYEHFTRSNYRAETLMDPHAASSDRQIMSNGWFDRSMPDLNQNNPFVANYLIQNSIWWIEYAGLSGIRMDTYPYSNQAFMKRWVDAVYAEYPQFNILGEAWLQGVSHTAYFQSGSFPKIKSPSKLRSVTDFPVYYAASNAFNQNDSWTDGVASLYMTLSQDFIYSNADSNVIFLENHDVNRFASSIQNDLAKWKMGMTFLMTTRGIPMLYHGGEFMMDGAKDQGDAMLRKDMPGGWLGDTSNVFSASNLSDLQIEALDFTRQLSQYRHQHPALQYGKLTHFVPKKGTYVYFRKADWETFMIIMNNNEEDIQIKTADYDEILQSFKSMQEFGSTQWISIPSILNLKPKTATIYELKP